MKLKLTHKQFVLLRSSMTIEKYIKYPERFDYEATEVHRASFDKLDVKLLQMLHNGGEVPELSEEELEITYNELDLLLKVVEAAMKFCDRGTLEGSKSNYLIHYGASRTDVEELVRAIVRYAQSEVRLRPQVG